MIELIELFKQNPYIIINTDIDGILSGIILQKYCGCQIAGFSNSKDTIWMADPNMSVYKPVYIDMFVPREDVYCIEQHIISVNQEHHQKWVNCKTKINPNLERGRVFENRKDYMYKYPFGTVHYLLALLGAEGIEVKLPCLNFCVDSDLKINIGDLILRADDAMKTTLDSNYMRNAQDWWQWLKDRSDLADSIYELCNYLEFIKREKVNTIKENTKLFFAKHYNCRTSDGGFSQILKPNGHELQDNIVKYIDDIARFMEVDFKYPKEYYTRKGRYNLLFWSKEWTQEFVNNNTIQGNDVFSYGFIFGPGGMYKNFSFTTFMKDENE